MRGLRARVASLEPARGDVLVALAIGLLLEIECLTSREIRGAHLLVTALASALLVAAVAFRRRRPGVALVTATGIAAAQSHLGGELGSTSGAGVLLALALLSYSAGAWLELRAALSALLLGAALFAGFILEIESGASAVLGPTVLVLVAPWAIGRLVRERTRRADAFRALAAQTEREQAERERAAVAQERLRIGAELQDIVAHSVSAMVIGAAGARRLLRSDPERARESIRTVEQTGRQTLADMRRLLGVLQTGGGPASACAPAGPGSAPRSGRRRRRGGPAVRTAHTTGSRRG